MGLGHATMAEGRVLKNNSHDSDDVEGDDHDDIGDDNDGDEDSDNYDSDGSSHDADDKQPLSH